MNISTRGYAHFGHLGLSQEIPFPEDSLRHPRKGCGSTGHVCCRHVLAFTRPLTVALQAKECDIYKAYRMAQRLVTSLENE